MYLSNGFKVKFLWLNLNEIQHENDKLNSQWEKPNQTRKKNSQINNIETRISKKSKNENNNIFDKVNS